MATWKTKITVVDLSKKRIRIVGTRTDGEDVRVYPCTGQVDMADLSGSKAKILASLQNQYTAEIAEESQIDAILSGWETNLDAAMDTWENE